MKAEIVLTSGLALAAAGALGGATGVQASDDPLLAGELEALRQRRVFFAHQSVGANLLEGMKRLAAQEGVPLQIVEKPDTLALAPGTFAHAHVGSNGDPVSKLQGFQRALATGPSSAVDVALVKFCYVDIAPSTDVLALFSTYQSTLSELRQRHPRTRFVHVTTPLTAIQSGPKAFVKRLLGRTLQGVEENARREEFNALLRQAYQGKEPIFDLAAIESTRLDGRRETASWNGGAIPVLVPAFTSDGGHLNRLGQLQAARPLVALLASIPLMPPEPAR